MKEAILIILLSLIFLFVSYKLHILLLKAKKVRFIILSIAYLLFVYFLLDGAVILHQYLRDHGIYLEFGHADELLIEFFLLWVVLAFINIIVIIIRRGRKKKDISNDF